MPAPQIHGPRRQAVGRPRRKVKSDNARRPAIQHLPIVNAVGIVHNPTSVMLAENPFKLELGCAGFQQVAGRCQVRHWAIDRRRRP